MTFAWRASVRGSMLEAPLSDPWTADLAVRLLGTSPLAAVIVGVGVPLIGRLRRIEATGERLDKAVEALAEELGGKLRKLGRRAHRAERRAKSAEQRSRANAEAIDDLARSLEVDQRHGAGRGRRRGPSPARSTTRGRNDSGS